MIALLPNKVDVAAPQAIKTTDPSNNDHILPRKI